MFIRNNRSKLTILLPMGFFNVAPKKRNVFLFYHFPKEYVGRSIQNAVNTIYYI